MRNQSASFLPSVAKASDGCWSEVNEHWGFSVVEDGGDVLAPLLVWLDESFVSQGWRVMLVVEAIEFFPSIHL